ncbi:MAG: hypothetical protein M4D80_15680 [Myxococcota bacterium]|nr:hypothetical protein [Deltaproteobacteria bacterium]MDQ3336607.1 hypothetical protein [Myxococcota bacterium]
MKRLTLIFILAACGTDGTESPGTCTLGEIVACDCSPGSVGSQTCDDNGAFGACGNCSAPDPDPAKVNFQAQIVPIINRSCGTNGVTGCHAREAYGASVMQDCRGWLTLENESLGSKFYSGTKNGQATGCPDKPLYERLVQIDVWQCLTTSVAYVTPGDLSKSYLVNKLDGVNMCKESASSTSEQMPPTDSMFTISAADKAVIKQWIMEGALNN